jgi:hypothetical protein
MTRYINSYFRFLPILLIPVILLPIITIGIGLTSKISYMGGASIFVEQSLISDQLDVVGGSPFQSPAQRNANFLTELLSTRTFVVNVINRTRFKGVFESNDAALREEILGVMERINIDNSRYHIVGMALEYKDPEIPREVLGAVVEEYFKVLDERLQRQVGPALQVYKKQLDEALKSQTNVEEELKTFLAVNAQQLSLGNNPDNTGRPLTQVDLDYSRLIQQREIARTQYETARAEYNRVETSYTAYRENRENLFRLQDPPQEELVPVQRTRIIMINGAIGIVGGLLLMILGMLLITWLDSSFRERPSVVRMLGIPGISVQDVPRIKSKSAKKKAKFSLRESMVQDMGWNEVAPQLPKPKAKNKAA